MPAKTKKIVVQPQEKETVKPVVKKKAVKKSLPKKRAVKKVVAKKTAAVVISHEEDRIVPVEVHHKYVFIGSCRNCEHMPMSANRLVAVLSIAIAILSGMLISTSSPINFRMPSISMSSLSDLITPDSNVQNL